MTVAQIRWVSAMSEAEFTSCVINHARAHGWLVCHFRPARTVRGYRTPIEGDKGCPDLIMVRRGRVLLVELKTSSGTVTREQRCWLAAAGEFGRLWKPKDWVEIVAELAAA